MIDLTKIDTERRNVNTMTLHKESTGEILRKINEEDKKVALAVEDKIEQIEKVVDCAFECYVNEGRIIYIGAGTSGRLGVLDASECPPTYGVSPEVFIGLIAGGDTALRNAKEGAEDSKELAVDDLKGISLSEKDIVIGIAASGRTPYVIGGLLYANKIGAKTASIATTNNSEIGKVADIAIEVPVGAEAVTGSTRMKSGTAQKMVLNMISTTIMIKAGKVYENLMVDVKATNEKLKVRAENILMEVSKISREEAVKLLNETNYDVKVSIVMHKNNFSYKEAMQELDKNLGYIN